MIRIILDTNVWISLMLRRNEQSPIVQTVAAAFSVDVELIVPQELFEELQSSVAKSSYLTNRIPKASVDGLIEQFYIGAVVQQQGQFTRDPDDDYLVVYSLAHAVDYLITGDLDLLALHQVEHLQIVTPRQFLESLYSA